MPTIRLNESLFDVEDLAEARHIEYPLYKRLEVADNQLAALGGYILVEREEDAQSRRADVAHSVAIDHYDIAQIHIQCVDVALQLTEVKCIHRIVGINLMSLEIISHSRYLLKFRQR